MHNLNLLEMDAVEMLDVIHYFLDEDMRYATPESAQMHSSVRHTLYGSLYNRPYKYGSSNKTSGESVEPAVKGYIPPTEFDADSSDPFGGVLDSPIQ